MSEIDFKIYEEQELVEVSRNIELLNDKLIELKDLVKTINTLTVDYSPDIMDLETELNTIRNEVLKAEKHLVRSNDYQNNNRKYTAFISGGLGSLAGGSFGMLLIPFMGPVTPLITSFIGGVTGLIYSLKE